MTKGRGNSSRAKILVVDDEIQVLDFLRLILENAGYSVQGAVSGVEAIRAVAETGFDLLILDMGLPDMAGQAVLAEIDQRARGLRVVLASGNAAPSMLKDLSRFGVVRVLAKPFSPLELVKVVNQVLCPEKPAPQPLNSGR